MKSTTTSNHISTPLVVRFFSNEWSSGYCGRMTSQRRAIVPRGLASVAQFMIISAVWVRDENCKRTLRVLDVLSCQNRSASAWENSTQHRSDRVWKLSLIDPERVKGNPPVNFVWLSRPRELWSVRSFVAKLITRRMRHFLVRGCSIIKRCYPFTNQALLFELCLSTPIISNNWFHPLIIIVLSA